MLEGTLYQQNPQKRKNFTYSMKGKKLEVDDINLRNKARIMFPKHMKLNEDTWELRLDVDDSILKVCLKEGMKIEFGGAVTY